MEEIESLEKKALEVRRDILKMIYEAGSGHPGGSLSCVDLIIAIYANMNLEKDSKGNRIDRFILSKGHAAPAYYAVLSQYGFIKKEELFTLRKIDSHLEGHPSNKTKGVDVSSGSLGQGLSIANGIALSKKILNEKGRVYCLCGDGELEEGQIWEALMTTNKYKLNNLVLIIDRNKLQIDGTTDEVKSVDNLKEKLEAFGMNVKEINGHDFTEIITALDYAKKSDKPVCLLANTIKGKGISFMENNVKWHGKAPNEEEYEIALKELN